MATNQTGIAITIKAFLPIGKNLDQQLSALTLVKTAHETSDYAPLLAAAKIDEVKTEQKTRRTEPEPVSPLKAIADDMAAGTATFGNVTASEADGQEPAAVTTTELAADPEPNTPEPALNLETDPDVPEFLKPKKKKAA